MLECGDRRQARTTPGTTPSVSASAASAAGPQARPTPAEAVPSWARRGGAGAGRPLSPPFFWGARGAGGGGGRGSPLLPLIFGGGSGGCAGAGGGIAVHHRTSARFRRTAISIRND